MLALLTCAALLAGGAPRSTDTLPVVIPTAHSVRDATARAGAVLQAVTGAHERADEHTWVSVRSVQSGDVSWVWTIAVRVAREVRPGSDAPVTTYTVRLDEVRHAASDSATPLAITTMPVHPEALAMWQLASEVVRTLQELPTIMATGDTVLVSLEALRAPPRAALAWTSHRVRAWDAVFLASTDGVRRGGLRLGWRPGFLGLFLEGTVARQDGWYQLPYAGDRITPLQAAVVRQHPSLGVTRQWAQAGGGVQLHVAGPLVVAAGGGYAWDRARRVFQDPSGTVSNRMAYTTQAYNVDAERGPYGTVSAQLLLGRVTALWRTDSRVGGSMVGLGWRW